jgi:hypothetical protein
MKRGVILVLLAALLLSLCGCGLLRSRAERCARDGWERAGEADVRLDEVYVMHYSSRRKLSDDVLDTPMYQKLPENGYAVLYHSRSRQFMDSYACFFDDGGKLVFTFDYEEYHDLYEEYYEDFSIYNIEAGEKAVEYLTNCNYISGMINDAADGKEFTSNMEKNIWYALSDAQIAWVVG